MENERKMICKGWILSGAQRRDYGRKLERLAEYEALGREPAQLQRMLDDFEDPAPLPLMPDDEYGVYGGLMKDKDWEDG